MKYIFAYLLVIIGVSPVGLSHEEELCKAALKQGIITVKGFKQMTAQQYAEYVSFLDKGIDTKLSYENGTFFIKQSGEFKVYSLKEDGVVDESKLYKYEKSISYIFDPKANARPYAYVPSIFKLGGVILYNKDSNAVYPDISLMVEVISFDKVFNTYGFGLNLSGGLKHVGISLSYQFIKTVFFKNTSVFLGYGYDFIRGGYAPFMGISLNF
jgi:hypothetical protein